MLKRALTNSGVCSALDKILAAGGLETAKKVELLKPLFDEINKAENAHFSRTR